eukprot:7117018-Pyramimonas_sp.AAC.1
MTRNSMILAKNPTICSCECRHCGYRLRGISSWGHATCEGCGAGPAMWALPLVFLGGTHYAAAKSVR